MNGHHETPLTSDELPIKRCKLDVDEENVTMYCSPAPLKDLAALKIALAIWRHHEFRFCKNQGYSALFYDLRNTDGKSFIYVPPYVRSDCYKTDNQPIMKPIQDSVDTLNLPTQTANSVVNQCKIRERELRLWAFRHKQLISLESFDIADIVWKSDGYIDYLRTVRNVLSLSKLDTPQKFELMSEYCLEDDIKSLSRYQIAASRWDMYHNPMQFYWICYLEGTLHRIHMYEYPYYFDHPTLDSYMLHRYVAERNLPSLDFFYNRLNDADRVSVSISLIPRLNDFQFVVAVLSKLNKSQYDRVLVRIADSVIMALGKLVEYENYILNVWIKYKDHIDESKFLNMIHSLYKYPKIDQRYHDHVDKLLFDIWDMATDEKRKYVWEEHYAVFLETEAPRWQFLKKMFTEADVTMKSNIVENPLFSSFCKTSIETQQWYYIDTFIKLFISGNDRVMEFKANLMHTAAIQKYCRKLFVKHGVEILDDLLDIFLPHGVAVLEYKKNLLSSGTYLKDFCIIELTYNRIAKLNEVIEYIFPDATEAAHFRLHLLLESKVVKMMCQFINEGKFDKMKNSIELLLTRSIDIESMKAKLLSEYRNTLKKGKCLHLRKVEWDKFLSWCSDSAKEQLKESLPVGDIFFKMVRKMIPAGKRGKLPNIEIKSHLEEIDYFLRWYFETKNEIDEYKNVKLYEYSDTLIKKISTKNLRGLCFVNLIVGWFFDGNQRLIDDFIREIRT